MTERKTLFRGATILTMDPSIPNLTTGDLLIHGDRIEAVSASIPADDAQVVEANGCIILPGFIDSHHHVWLGTLRRLMPNCADINAYFALIAETVGSKFRPLDMYLSTKLTATGALDAGITTIIDAAHNSRTPEHSDASLAALRDSGIRALHMVGNPTDKQFDDVYLPGDLVRLAKTWNHPESLIQVGFFGHLRQKLDQYGYARSLDLRVLFEMVGSFSKLPEEFKKPGVLGAHCIFNHCTRIPKETWQILADSGVNVTVNPRSDVLFGFDEDHLAYQTAVDFGFKPALGIDIQTTYGGDMFGEMQALFHLQRATRRYRELRGEESTPPPISVEAVLQAATVNGARAAGLEHKIGTLTPGKQADLIMIRTDSVGVFPVTNAIAAVVHAVSRSDVDTVMVAGNLRKRNGHLIDVDVQKLLIDVDSSRRWLEQASGHHPHMFDMAV